MAGVNKVIILGRIGRDPELSFANSGLAVCKFSMATSKKRKDGQEITAWHRCVAFGKTAEIIEKYVGKGDPLYVEGELSYGQYEKDGVTHYTTDIIVNQINFVGGGERKRKGSQSVNNRQQGSEPSQDYDYDIPF